MTHNILIVDDEEDIRMLIKGILEDEGFVCDLASGATEAYDAISNQRPDLIVLDIWLQGSVEDGLDILKNIKETNPDIPVVMISGHGTIETAVNSIKHGAYDFIEKPFKSDRLILMIRRALETENLRQENQALKQQVSNANEMVGSSTAMETLQQTLGRVAPTNSRILLTGEPGTGKDVAAKYIHDKSKRGNHPFMVLNCATMRSEDLEMELFGTQDAKSGKVTHIGTLEKAHKGSLLFDEIADMPLDTQSKIIRVLQNQSFTRIGGQTPIEVDVRVIASTNRDLQKEIEDGNFRQDLYYRLNVVPIELPPLRERTKDIESLAEYFLRIISKTSGLPKRKFSSSAIAFMKSYAWPGNIRQLRNVIEWVMIMRGKDNENDEYQIQDLPPGILGHQNESSDSSRTKGNNYQQSFIDLPLRDARENFEKTYLQEQIQRFDGNISKTAKFIGMERSALHRKLKTLDILGNEDKNTQSEHTKEQHARKRA